MVAGLLWLAVMDCSGNAVGLVEDGVNVKVVKPEGVAAETEAVPDTPETGAEDGPLGAAEPETEAEDTGAEGGGAEDEGGAWRALRSSWAATRTERLARTSSFMIVQGKRCDCLMFVVPLLEHLLGVLFSAVGCSVLSTKT